MQILHLSVHCSCCLGHHTTLAVSEEYSEKTGKYFDNDKGNPKGSFGEAHRDAYDAGAIQELITNTDQILLGNTL